MSVMEMGRQSAASGAGAEDAQPSVWSQLQESARIRPRESALENVGQLVPYVLPETPRSSGRIHRSICTGAQSGWLATRRA